MRPLASRRIAIVGAGPGGLAAAMMLGHAGADVTVYERHGDIGGVPVPSRPTAIVSISVLPSSSTHRSCARCSNGAAWIWIGK